MESQFSLQIIGLVMFSISMKFWIQPKACFSKLISDLLNNELLCTQAGIIPLAIGLCLFLPYLPEWQNSLASNTLIIFGAFLIFIGLFRLLFTGTWKSAVMSSLDNLDSPLNLVRFGLSTIAICPRHSRLNI